MTDPRSPRTKWPPRAPSTATLIAKLKVLHNRQLDRLLDAGTPTDRTALFEGIMSDIRRVLSEAGLVDPALPARRRRRRKQ